jgi:hypothetical protein
MTHQEVLTSHHGRTYVATTEKVFPAPFRDVIHGINPGRWAHYGGAFIRSTPTAFEGAWMDDCWSGEIHEHIRPWVPWPGKRLELEQDLRVRMSRTARGARVEFWLARSRDGRLSMDEGHLTCEWLGENVRISAEKRIRFAAGDPLGALPHKAAEFGLSWWMAGEFTKFAEHIQSRNADH